MSINSLFLKIKFQSIQMLNAQKKEYDDMSFDQRPLISTAPSTKLGGPLSFFSSLVSYISMGQYETKLYHRRSRSSTSLCGGLVTIIFVGSLLFYSIILLVSVFKTENFYINHTAVPLAHYYSEDGEFPLIKDLIINPQGLNIKVRDFVPLLQYHKYIVKFRSIEEMNCADLTLNMRFLQRGNQRWHSLSNSTFKNNTYTPECYISLANEGIFEEALIEYGDELAFYQFYVSKHIFSRFNPQINGLPGGDRVEVYRLFGNDTHINEAGMSTINHHSDEVYPRSQLIENYKLLHYEEISDFTGLKLFNKVDKQQFALQTLGVDSMEKIQKYPEDQIAVHLSFLANSDYYQRYPESLVMVLSKIGGLLALLKIGFALRLFHRYEAESELQKIVKQKQQRKTISDASISQNGIQNRTQDGLQSSLQATEIEPHNSTNLTFQSIESTHYRDVFSFETFMKLI